MSLTDEQQNLGPCLLCEGSGEVLGGVVVDCDPFTGATREELFPEECPRCEGSGIVGGARAVAEHDANAQDLEEGRWD